MSNNIIGYHDAEGTNRFDVCAVGNAIVDFMADSDDAFLQSQGIAKGVMTLVDEEQAETLYNRITPNMEVSGGSAANTMVGIASLGGITAFIGKVGDDHPGEVFRHGLTINGIHFATPSLAVGIPTARSIILVTPDAQRSMSTFLGASVQLTTSDIDVEVISSSKITYLEGYLFDRPSAQEAFRLAAKTAHSAGKKLALALSDPMCVDRHREDFLELVRNQVDILIANEKEIMALYRTTSFEAAMGAARGNCSLVVGTRSEKGSVIMAGEQTWTLAAEKVEKVVDPTGAGDMFAAGFLYGLTHGHDLAECGKLGSIMAAAIITHYGSRPQISLRHLAVVKGIALKD